MMETRIITLENKQERIEIERDSYIVGIFVGKNDDVLDYKLDVVHTKPNLKSLTEIKAITFDRADISILGNLIIGSGAKNTDAYLRIDVLMMSKTCKARAVPSLEITQDFVKGGHGATVGPIDEEILFYLMSRGLKQSDAESLIARGFIDAALNKIGDETYSNQIINKLS